MSPRAAARLEALSFDTVYDYAAGKAGWLASGLPTERARAELRAGDLARRDVPTCTIDEPFGEVRERTLAAGWSECIVIDDERVVLGRVGAKALAANAEKAEAQADVESAMDPGPATIRPDTPLESVVERLRKRDRARALITTADGQLVGVLQRADAEQRLAAQR